ncbi:MAG: hypothetical protein EOP77_00575 [Variovorax sp.]|nr:MAG: hypothetical protein EOP77_00575 [Variovorax sp.]
MCDELAACAAHCVQLAVVFAASALNIGSCLDPKPTLSKTTNTPVSSQQSAEPSLSGRVSVNVKVDGQTTFNSTVLMLQAALDGLGFAYVPYDLMKPHIDAGRLIPVLEYWWPTFPGYNLYYANRRQIAPALALVIGTLRYRPPERQPATAKR